MKKLKNKLFYLYSFLIYMLLIIIFVFIANRFIQPFAYSFLMSNIISKIEEPNENIIEVVFDDVTNQKYNWRNDPKKIIITDLLDYFYSYAKPKIIGLDITYTSVRDNGDNSAPLFVNQVSKMNNLVSAFVPEEDKNNSDGSFINNFKQKHSLNVIKDVQNQSMTAQNGILSYSDNLRNSTKHFGSVIINKDNTSDFIFDTINIVKIRNAYYPSLSFKMYLLANNTNEISIYDNYILVPSTGLKIPYKYENGFFYTPIRYYDFPWNNNQKITYSHNAISAFKLLDTYKALQKGLTPKTAPELYNLKDPNSLIDPALFNDKIIFIGENISGPGTDVLRTPMDTRHPGVDIQASVYDNLYSQILLNNSGKGINFLIFILLCIPTFIIILRARFLKGLITLISLDLLYLFIITMFAINGYVTEYASPLICQFVTAIFAYTFKFLNESRNKEQIKTAMGKYLSQDVMQNIIKDIENLGLGGKRAIVTILFSDIRGFTSMSEKMPADEVSKILNEYFAHMEPIIRKYNGVINKFIGDAIMVIFGEPIQDLNHPRNAVKCAYEMLKEVEHLRENWLAEGKPRFEIGIGINTGEVFIGNIGTENRMEYTAIGDNVNLASRIEGYNKVYKTNLLVSTSTYNHISDCADVIKIKEVQIRGKSKKMDIYEVLRMDLEK